MILCNKHIKFEVIGKVVGKGRPRISTRGGFPRAYTPQNTRDYERLIVMSYKKENNYCCKNAVRVKVTFIKQPPKSTSKKLRKDMLSGLIPCTKKPDLDNVVKSVLDALNGVAYEDDNQVNSINAYKCYGEEEKLIIEIMEESI